MGPFCRLPLTGDIMVTTLSGVRCLPFGLWQPPDIGARRCASPQLADRTDRKPSSPRGAARADIVYSVYDVRPGDTLNMRVRPDPRAAVVQTIPHDADGITLTGRTAPGEWVEATFRPQARLGERALLGLGHRAAIRLPALPRLHRHRALLVDRVTPGHARADMMFAEKPLLLPPDARASRR